jgi:hypothetical protein
LEACQKAEDVTAEPRFSDLSGSFFWVTGFA